MTKRSDDAKRSRRAKADGRHPPIEARNRHFDLAGVDLGRWHSDNPYISHFWNGLSLMFPDGERFFMDSVRRLRDEIEDPELQRHITAFLSQEGIHAREHAGYNQALRDQGYPSPLLTLVTRFSLWSARLTPARWQLAITCAFEHFTATLADAVLARPEVMESSAPQLATLWRWHCAEETEHKAVAFDVYRAVAPGLFGYLGRTAAMLCLSVNFLPYVMFHQLTLSAFDRVLPDLGAAGGALRFFWTRPALIPRGFRLYLSYYRPDFHPWDHDNAELLRRWRDAEGSP